MPSHRIWIDTDPALGVEIDGAPRDVDDAYVLVEALETPEVELAGISVVFGNAPLELGLGVARAVLDAKGSTQPVHAGAAEAGHEAGPTPAVLALAEALRAGRLDLLAIGPLTNVAQLVHHFPDEARRIDRCVVVAGRSYGVPFEIGGARGVPDFNFESDWRAAQCLLDFGLPLAMVGFEVSHRVAVTREDLEAIRERSDATRLLVDRSLPWLESWTKTFPSDAGFHPWDSAALAYLLHPEWFEVEERGCSIRHVRLPAEGPPEEATPGAEGATPWFETAHDLPGPKVLFCPDFAPGGGRAFVDAMLAAQR